MAAIADKININNNFRFTTGRLSQKGNDKLKLLFGNSRDGPQIPPNSGCVPRIPSAGAIYWAVALMAVGMLLLVQGLGHSVPIWGYVVRGWPVLLIGWGISKIVDYRRLRNAVAGGPLFSRSEVALLMLVVFAGSALTTAANVSSDLANVFDIEEIDLWDITGNNFTFDEHHELVVPSGSRVEIVNRYGNVDIGPSDSDRLILDVNKTVRASNKEEADQLSKDFRFSIDPSGAGYRIISNRDAADFRDTPRQRFKSSLRLQVPKRLALRIDNRNGKVSIQGLEGNQQVSNRYGPVDIRGVIGDVQIENRKGSVTVEDIKGAVSINNVR